MDGKTFTINQIMTVVEAAERYNVNPDSLRNKFKKSVTSEERMKKWVDNGLVRRSGGTWLISEQFMEIYFVEKF